MKLSNLSPAEGSNRDVKRIGRGHGSGNGKTAGKGHKGQKARATLQRRIPKRGFNNIFAKQYAEVNVDKLNVFEDGATVDVVALIEKGIIKKELDGVRILGNGELTKNLTVKAAAFTGSAAKKIEAAGGKAEVV